MPRTAQISRPSILATALKIADAHGLDAVTMHAVARHLNVTTMALYRHVASKADLLDGMVELLLTEFPPAPPGLPWDARLTMLSAGIRATARRHPGAFTLLLSRPAVTPAALRVRDAIHQALREAGVPGTDIARTERLISTAVLGFALSEAAGRFRHHDQDVIDEDFAELQRWLRHALPAGPADTPAVPSQ
jgi:AcrR family transcriptional regulator